MCKGTRAKAVSIQVGTFFFNGAGRPDFNRRASIPWPATPQRGMQTRVVSRHEPRTCLVGEACGTSQEWYRPPRLLSYATPSSYRHAARTNNITQIACMEQYLPTTFVSFVKDRTAAWAARMLGFAPSFFRTLSGISFNGLGASRETQQYTRKEMEWRCQRLPPGGGLRSAQH